MPVLYAYCNFIYLVYIYIEGYYNIKAHEPDSCPQGYVSYSCPTDDFSAVVPDIQPCHHLKATAWQLLRALPKVSNTQSLVKLKSASLLCTLTPLSYLIHHLFFFKYLKKTVYILPRLTLCLYSLIPSSHALGISSSHFPNTSFLFLCL